MSARERIKAEQLARDNLAALEYQANLERIDNERLDKLLSDLKTLLTNEKLKAWGYAFAFAFVSKTVNESGVILTGAIKWPDGVSGVFTTTAINSVFNAVDAWEASYLADDAKNIVQNLVTRDEFGIVINQPEILII